MRRLLCFLERTRASPITPRRPGPAAVGPSRSNAQRPQRMTMGASRRGLDTTTPCPAPLDRGFDSPPRRPNQSKSSQPTMSTCSEARFLDRHRQYPDGDVRVDVHGPPAAAAALQRRPPASAGGVRGAGPGRQERGRARRSLRPDPLRRRQGACRRAGSIDLGGVDLYGWVGGWVEDGRRVSNQRPPS